MGVVFGHRGWTVHSRVLKVGCESVTALLLVLGMVGVPPAGAAAAFVQVRAKEATSGTTNALAFTPRTLPGTSSSSTCCGATPAP